MASEGGREGVSQVGSTGLWKNMGGERGVGGQSRREFRRIMIALKHEKEIPRRKEGMEEGGGF